MDLAAFFLAAISNLSAQSKEKGFTWYRNTGEARLRLSTPDDNATNWKTCDAYVDVRFHVPNPVVNYTSVVTGGGPTGSFARGFSTGRATITCDNHLDRRFGPFTRFANASLGNTTCDRDYFYRPYRTLGFLSQFEGGTTYKVLPWLYVGASYYDVLPGGTQKIYSQIFQRESTLSRLEASHGRVFETAFPTTGPASIARDSGYSGWLGFGPIRNVDLEAGCTRSVRYPLDVFSFRVGVNVGNRIIQHF